MSAARRAFTLLELLIVVAIVGLLAGLVLPALSRARRQSQTLTCLTRLRELSRGWQIYADQNDGVLLPGRMYKKPGGTQKRENWYDVGNGLKYRPRWIATMGAQVGIFAFDKPRTDNDRQDYDNDAYQCPAAPQWTDERNHAYGYNHQFLGNARQTNDRFHNFPVYQSQIRATTGTVIAGDCMGTAAGVARTERLGYQNDGTAFAAEGNHAWTLDPPRLTDESDRGSGDEGSPRSAVDPRHGDKANVVFADAHGETRTPHELGYRVTAAGCYADLDPNEECEAAPPAEGGEPGRWPPPGPGPAPLSYGWVRPGLEGSLQQPEPFNPEWTNNRMFSGTGKDDDPPPLPE